MHAQIISPAFCPRLLAGVCAAEFASDVFKDLTLMSPETVTNVLPNLLRLNFKAGADSSHSPSTSANHPVDCWCQSVHGHDPHAYQ
eukprot:6193324-Pleurochrysis_carterae.AAC.2